MKNKKLLIAIYFCSLTPLISGSVVFYYWYYRKTEQALNSDIEFAAFWCLLSYLILGFISVILTVIFITIEKNHRVKMIVPILCTVLTFPAIHIYSGMHKSLANAAYLKIINDQDEAEIDRIWSANYEDKYLRKRNREFIYSYYPVQTIDWDSVLMEYSGIKYHPIELNSVYIDLDFGKDSIVTFQLASLSKGGCGSVKLSDIIGEYPPLAIRTQNQVSARRSH